MVRPFGTSNEMPPVSRAMRARPRFPAFAGSRHTSGSNGQVELDRIGETNGIQDSVRALGKLDRGRDGGVVAEGDAIGQQDKRLAPWLLSHDLFRALSDRTKDECRVVTRDSELPQRRRQTLPRGCQILENPDLRVEVGNERFVAVLAQDVVEKRVARAPL